MGRGLRDGEGKRMKMCYARVPAPHAECNHYVLQKHGLIKMFKKKKKELLLKTEMVRVFVAHLPLAGPFQGCKTWKIFVPVGCFVFSI